MKKFTLLLVFLLSVSYMSFSQSKEEKIFKIIQLIEENDKSLIYETLSKVKCNATSTELQSKFKDEVSTLISNHKKETISFFDKKFDQNDVDEVCKELSRPSLIGNTQKTVSFTMFWRSKRRELQQAFNQIVEKY